MIDTADPAERAVIRTNQKRRKLFREVNERIREVNESFTVGAAPVAIDVFCECGQSGCLERVQVPTDVYGNVRDREGHFLVSHGHEDRERVLEEGETYRIVALPEREHASQRVRPMQLEPQPMLSEAP